MDTYIIPKRHGLCEHDLVEVRSSPGEAIHMSAHAGGFSILGSLEEVERMAHSILEAIAIQRGGVHA